MYKFIAYIPAADLETVKAAHPYEVPAYDVYRLADTEALE